MIQKREREAAKERKERRFFLQFPPLSSRYNPPPFEGGPCCLETSSRPFFTSCLKVSAKELAVLESSACCAAPGERKFSFKKNYFFGKRERRSELKVSFEKA